jgi:hypothetical protein
VKYLVELGPEWVACTCGRLRRKRLTPNLRPTVTRFDIHHHFDAQPCQRFIRDGTGHTFPSEPPSCVWPGCCGDPDERQFCDGCPYGQQPR